MAYSMFCPKCGKPVIRRRYYDRDRIVSYIHEETIKKNPFPHVEITEYCEVKLETRTDEKVVHDHS